MEGEKKVDVDDGDIFKYKFGKWVLSVDECAFMSLRDIEKNKSMRQYLIESVDSWVNKKEVFFTDEFISEMCDFIKSENEDLYYLLMKKCALKGISVGEGIFEALNLLNCGTINEQQCRQAGDDFSDE
ncbi:hypothetical protein RG963_07430 [Methanosarcina sp. Z-7115]|uniref:Uncharacterized protein n=1 Tax=Methanosarcina baikalica TaxID=3073890 RepID=A0ABU2D0W5_9EURY|nr:hypothetical protein [Methanosarcina sp. Z-7115]MDR7665609.1 hypothetical protein [Methanosarcina sp. Z-7115]